MSTKSIRAAGPTEERTVAFASVILAISLVSFLWPRFDLTKNQHPQVNLGPRPSLSELPAATQ